MGRVLLAAKRTAFNNNNSSMVNLLSTIIEKQTDATKLMHQLNQSQMRTDEESFSVFIENSMSKSAYHDIQIEDQDRYPPYRSIQKMKDECCSDPEAISTTKSSVRVKLRKHLHTADRIVKMNEMNILNHMVKHNKQLEHMVLLSSWGLDETSRRASGWMEHREEHNVTRRLIILITVTLIYWQLLQLRSGYHLI